MGTLGQSFDLAWNGAIKVNRVRTGRTIQTSASETERIGDDADFNASQYNGIFGRSNTVQVDALKIQLLIRSY